MNKIGTHNSLSYLKPQWWLRLTGLGLMAKCQEVPVEQQYKLGARFFDIRIRFRKNKVVAAHGMATFKDVDLNSIFTFFNRKKDVTVRIVLENHMFSKDKTKDDAKFRDLVYGMVKKYKNVTFTSGIRKRPWTIIVTLPDKVDLRDCYEHFEGNQIKLPRPKYWAKKKNKEYWSQVDDTAYSLFDFINIK
jgi:hypothetical protein|nr:MAG TPA: hypothetical protein [Bacteriophage sp.]